eukprot:11213090-Lingulodinium_polyedra.AAC.1
MAGASSSSAQRCAWSRWSQNLKSMETLTDNEFDEGHATLRNDPCTAHSFSWPRARIPNLSQLATQYEDA